MPNKLIKIKCNFCGKTFKDFISQRKKYCSRKCVSNSLRGRIPWNKGLKTPEKIRIKIRKNHADVSKEKHPLWGNPRSKKTKKLLSNAQLGKKSYWYGKKHTKKHNKKISLSKLGNKIWFNKHHSKKTIKLLSRLRTGNKNPMFGKSGKNSPTWIGGTSFLPYSPEWTKSLKKSIRKRDNYKCYLCDKPQKKQTFIVHHIDYNKLNCNFNNLITLCRSCHSKTNYNRDYWINYFNNHLST